MFHIVPFFFRAPFNFGKMSCSCPTWTGSRGSAERFDLWYRKRAILVSTLVASLIFTFDHIQFQKLNPDIQSFPIISPVSFGISCNSSLNEKLALLTDRFLMLSCISLTNYAQAAHHSRDCLCKTFCTAWLGGNLPIVGVTGNSLYQPHNIFV